jgi:hypothetical protein
MDYSKINLFNLIIKDIESLKEKIMILDNEDYYIYLNVLENFKNEIEKELYIGMMKEE